MTLLEDIARGIMDRFNEGSSSQYEEINSDDAMNLARAALAAIEASGTHRLVPVSLLEEIVEGFLHLLNETSQVAEVLGRPDLKEQMIKARDKISERMLSARPQVIEQ